ncbi:MAG: isoaspartyl peptidase/L-asparaginase [Polyangiaceae bacterium]
MNELALTSWSSPGPTSWSILVHGGAGDVPVEKRPAHAAGCAAAVDRARRLLESGASALDAAAEAVVALEDDPCFNAGTGASLNLDGAPELDASIMCGESLRAGAVCALVGFKNPVLVARAALERGEHVLYAADGAKRFALANDFKEIPASELVTDAARRKLEAALAAGHAKNWAGGTVGAVVRDARGHIAAATSTGGTAGKYPGRVGDSPIVGAGSYADDALGGCSATGYGEGILKAVASYRASALASAQGPRLAADALVTELAARWQAPAGLIVIAADGRLAWCRSTASMSWAAAWEGAETASGF